MSVECFPNKHAHFLIHHCVWVHAKSLQSCLTLCHPMEHSLLDSWRIPQNTSSYPTNLIILLAVSSALYDLLDYKLVDDPDSFFFASC